MTNALQGVVHGKVIVLTEDSGLSDGERVEVFVRVQSDDVPSAEWGEGLRLSAGSLAHDASLDTIMEQIQAERKRCVLSRIRP